MGERRHSSAIFFFRILKAIFMPISTSLGPFNAPVMTRRVVNVSPSSKESAQYMPVMLNDPPLESGMGIGSFAKLQAIIGFRLAKKKEKK